MPPETETTPPASTESAKTQVTIGTKLSACRATITDGKGRFADARTAAHHLDTAVKALDKNPAAKNPGRHAAEEGREFSVNDGSVLKVLRGCVTQLVNINDDPTTARPEYDVAREAVTAAIANL
jgi:hypothetical protein